MLFLVLLFGILCVIVLGLFLQGAPYVPSRPAQVRAMLELAQVRPGETMVDLGAGDGCLLEAFAKAGAVAHGYEINPTLVWIARRRLRRVGVSGRAFVHWGSLWRADVRAAEIVTVFALPHVMGRLERKLRRELKSGARVLSNGFRFPHWPVVRDADRVFLFL